MSDSGYPGQQQPTDALGDFNSTRAIAFALIAAMNVGTLVKVQAVTNAGDLSPVGFVDVQPLVNQVDGAGKSTPHGALHRLPYFRLQGGTDAIIIDPKVGDLGIAVFADRDISSVSNAKAQANPGSGRRFDMADGLYIGGVLNGTPSQYIRYSAAGIEMHSPTKVKITAPEVEIDAATSLTTNTPLNTVNAAETIINGALAQGTGSAGGAATLQGPVTVVEDLTAGGKSVEFHTHLENGAGNQTNPPT